MPGALAVRLSGLRVSFDVVKEQICALLGLDEVLTLFFGRERCPRLIHAAAHAIERLGRDVTERLASSPGEIG